MHSKSDFISSFVGPKPSNLKEIWRNKPNASKPYSLVELMPLIARGASAGKHFKSRYMLLTHGTSRPYKKIRLRKDSIISK